MSMSGMSNIFNMKKGAKIFKFGQNGLKLVVSKLLIQSVILQFVELASQGKSTRNKFVIFG